MVPSSTWAAISLTADPLQGGTTLRFGGIDTIGEVNRDVRIRVNTNESQQYQIYARLIDPLTNEQGQTLGPTAIKLYGMPGSNGSGSLYIQTPQNLSQAEDLLYTSSPNGDSDSFTVVYQTRNDWVTLGGNFNGRILFTVRGGGSQETAILNISLDKTSELKVNFEGPNHSKTIELSQRDLKSLDLPTVEVSINGNPGGLIRIYQEVNSLPSDSTAAEVNPQLIKTQTISDDHDSPVINAPTNLTRGRNLLCESSKSTSACIVKFELDPEIFSEHPQGDYRSQIKFIAQGDSILEEESFDLHVAIEPNIEMSVVLPPEGMKFGDVVPGLEPKISEVTVNIKSNLGRPYMISQRVVSAMTNQSGDTVPPEYFTIKTDSLDGGPGKGAFDSFQSVKPGDSTIFFSDNKGSSTQFKVFYRLKSSSNMKPGNYTTSITYSLGEI